MVRTRLLFLLLGALCGALPAAAQPVDADTETVYIPVPQRRIEAEAVIKHEDIIEVAVDGRRLSPTVVRDRRNLVGMAAKKPLEENKVINTYDIAAPLLVKRNELVTMVVKSEVMQLTAQGRALENGAMGDVVRVLNTGSKKTVEGIVTGAGTVELGATFAPTAIPKQAPAGGQP